MRNTFRLALGKSNHAYQDTGPEMEMQSVRLGQDGGLLVGPRLLSD
jgi:hypothetical protein